MSIVPLTMMMASDNPNQSTGLTIRLHAWRSGHDLTGLTACMMIQTRSDQTYERRWRSGRRVMMQTLWSQSMTDADLMISIKRGLTRCRNVFRRSKIDHFRPDPNVFGQNSTCCPPDISTPHSFLWKNFSAVGDGSAWQLNHLAMTPTWRWIHMAMTPLGG